MKKFSTDILIVGAGLFGSMTAKHLRSVGYSVTIIDCQKDKAASKCSSGIYRDGWISKIKKEVEIGMPIIEQFTTPKTIQLWNEDKEKHEEYKQINVSEILNEDYIHAEITDLGINPEGYCDFAFIRLLSGKRKGDIVHYNIKSAVIVCAGVWTGAILREFGYEGIGLDSQWGVTFEYEHEHEKDFISTWAPYRQLYGFNRGNGKFYFTGGVTVKNPKKTDKRKLTASDRMLKQSIKHGLPPTHICQVNEGYRPYLQKGEEYVKKVDKNVFAASGGAKNSTVLSGYIAKTIHDLMRKSNLFSNFFDMTKFKAEGGDDIRLVADFEVSRFFDDYIDLDQAKKAETQNNCVLYIDSNKEIIECTDMPF